MRWMTLFSLVFLLTIFSPNLWADEADSSKLDETYVAFIEDRNFESAYEYISDATDSTTRLYIACHLMMGSGVEQDECAAVRILEEMYPDSPILAVSALNFIYSSSWKTVAFLEGSPKAAYALGLFYDAVHESVRLPLLDKHGNYFGKKAFTYFKIAEERGYPVEDEILMKFDGLEVDANIYEIEPRRILCPVRQ